ncbi:MAG TPA: DUF4126 domain-containing protein [Burkholderiales bacterium]|nr:DUF4126 domain-containing protein [Burkholderiales bacterium]
MEAVQTIALTMGLAWASGINLYAAIFMLGLMGSTGHIVLPPDLQVLTDPYVILAAGFMYCVEFFADKVPGVDTSWDTLHTFIRIPAAALLAAKAVGPVEPSIELVALILGGTLGAATHFTKMGSRILINTSPEPFSNWTASLTEDVVVFAGLWTALQHPVVFLVLLAVFIVLIIWALPRLYRAIKAILARVKGWLSSAPEAAPQIENKTPAN